MSAKRCARCREVKTRSDYHRNARKSDGLNSQCKQCRSEVSKIRYATDPEFRAAALARAKKFAQRHPEYASEAGARFCTMRPTYDRDYKRDKEQVVRPTFHAVRARERRDEINALIERDNQLRRQQ